MFWHTQAYLHSLSIPKIQILIYIHWLAFFWCKIKLLLYEMLFYHYWKQSFTLRQSIHSYYAQGWSATLLLWEAHLQKVFFPIILKYSLCWNGSFPGFVFKIKCFECGHGATACIDTSKSFPRRASRVRRGTFLLLSTFLIWASSASRPFPKQKCSTLWFCSSSEERGAALG